MSCPAAPGTPAPPAGPTSCGPPAGGNTCSTSAIASLGNQGGVNVGAGNPINVISGNKYQREDDLPALPGVLGLEIVRHYNSAYSTAGTATGIVGRGWKLSYETDLYAIGNTLQIMQADGTRIIFSRDPANRSLCSTVDPANGRLTIVKSVDGEQYNWTWTNGRILNFNSDGKLVQIVAPTGEFVSLQRDPKGLLMQVTDPQGRQLRLQYPERATATGNKFGGVASIVSPVGTFTYRYGGILPAGSTAPPASIVANLVGVSYPEGGGRVYHYEDAMRPTFLTGISLVGNSAKALKPAGTVPPMQRIGTYLYNVDGRAVLTVHGTPARLQLGADGKPLSPARLVAGTGMGQVVLNYATPGQTLMTNSLGQTTVYKHAIVGGEYRLLEVRGAGCSRCGEMNMRYGYDKLGRLIDITQLMKDGTPLARLHSNLDPQGRVTDIFEFKYADGIATPPQLRRRFEYLDGTTRQPATIRRPSVVPGREVVTRIRYNGSGQPLQIDETGWSPPVEPLKKQPSEIARRFTFHYATINGRSLLTAIDGPLKNGPQENPSDSDITNIRYDRNGNFPVDIIRPGNLVTRIIERNQAGNVTKIASGDAVNDLKKQETIYNAHGQVTAIFQPRNESAVTPKTWHEDWFGIVQNWLRIDGSKAAVKPGLSTTVSYDAFNRPHRVTQPDGSWIEAIYDDANRPVGYRDQDGNTDRRNLGTEDQLLDTFLSSGNAAIALNLTKSFRYDDQGRIINVSGSDESSISYHYDKTTDKLVKSTDELDRPTNFRYDNAGRLIWLAQEVSKADSAITRFGYTGHSLLVDSVTADNGATTGRTIDDFDRVVAVDSPDSGRKTAEYDAADRLIVATDGNGNRSFYRYDAAGQLVERRTTSHAEDRQPEVQTDSFEFNGTRLVRMKNDDQSTELRYDTDGRLIEKIDVLLPMKFDDATRRAVLKPVRFSTHFAYDEQNRLVLKH